MEHYNEKLDCLFLHIPKITEKKASVLIMPMGITALCNELSEKGIKSKIMNLIIPNLFNPSFSIIEHLKKTETKILCFSLHWHPTSYNVMETLKSVKQALPDIYTVIGGFTASYFHREIMENFPEVDFIIRGDGELPIKILAEQLLGKKETSFGDIPNLTWREKNNIITNEQTYKITQDIFDNLYYGNLDLIYDRDLNLTGTWFIDFPLKQEDIHGAVTSNKKYFFYNPGRGCNVHCSFCGGGNIAQEMINKRKGVIYKSHESVIKDIKGAVGYGVNYLYTCFDPHPSSTDYYIELFKKIKENNIDINVHFESWHLPKKEFLDAFKDNLLPDSEIIISPDSGSDEVRKYNKEGSYYTTEELMETLDYIYKKQIKTSLYFTAGLPSERAEDINKTKELIKNIRSGYGFKVYIFPCEMEPGSLMYLYPERYGINMKRKSFMDFYNQHNNQNRLGYDTAHFTEEEIREYIKMLEETAS